MSRRLPAVLLPPSKGQRAGGSGPAWSPGSGVLPSLDPARARVLDALVAAMGRGRHRHPDPSALLGASGKTLAAACEANAAVRSSPTRPAIERFDGVLYTELGYADLPAAVRRRLDAMVLVFTAGFGVVAPRDPIPEHRLDFHAALPALQPVGSTHRLAAWWRPQLIEALAGQLAGRVVWDLLPQEHAAAWDPTAVAVRARYTVAFVDRGGKVVSHWNKLLKGALVAWLGETAATEAEQLVTFEHPLGYRFDPAASTLTPTGGHVILRER